MGDSRQPLAPALTAEEWECDKDGYREIEIADLGVWHRDTPNSLGIAMAVYAVHGAEAASLDERQRHLLAALCLYGKPFGFTHHDVEFLYDMISEIPSNETEADDWGGRFHSLASRIASLLPPRTP